MLALVVTAGTAHADPGINWDAIAQCESGGNWQIASGNGYYGGLQFALSTWRAFGGTGIPQNASRAEQIRVANNVLHTQGIGACAGLVVGRAIIRDLWQREAAAQQLQPRPQAYLRASLS